MIVTVTNTSGAAINALATGDDGVATGGHRTQPLPYPFGHIGELADSASSVLAVQPRDFRHGEGGMGTQMARGLPASVRWNQLVQAGVVTFAQAAQTGRTDVEELYVAAV